MAKNKLDYSPLSRGLLAAVFIFAGLDKLRHPEKARAYAASKKLPAVDKLMPLVPIIEIGGGLAILLGLRGRLISTLLAGYMIPVSVIFHDFWSEKDEMKREMALVEFLKNLAITGGLLELSSHEPARLSVDSRLALRELKKAA